MTVKRFKLVEYLPNVIRIEDNHQKLNGHKIVDLLNELHEENKELRKDVIYWWHKALNEEPVNCNCKVELNDIVGIVKTDEQINSVELKKELYK